MSFSLSTNYNFPREVPLKAAQGFVATAVINLFLGTTAKVAVVGGVLAVTATLIEAVTRPIIKEIFPKNPTIVKFIQIIIPHMMALSLAPSIAPWVGVSYKMTSFVLPLITWICLNDNFYEKNVGMVQIL